MTDAAPMPFSSALTGRPIKIDPADGPCPHCAAWAAAKYRVFSDGTPARACDDCGLAIPRLPAMDGNGYESQTTHHYHLGKIEGLVTWLPVMRELCPACYRIDYAKAFPNSPVPV